MGRSLAEAEVGLNFMAVILPLALAINVPCWRLSDVTVGEHYQFTVPNSAIENAAVGF